VLDGYLRRRRGRLSRRAMGGRMPIRKRDKVREDRDGSWGIELVDHKKGCL
jgi:hypothetical protein